MIYIRSYHLLTLVSKPNPNSNSMQLGLRLDIVLNANPPHTTPPQTFQLLLQTRKKLIFVRKPIFRIEKCPQIHIFPNHTKVTYIDFFPKILEIFEEK